MARAARFVVGLTGGIGSGKSTVARMFAELGADVVDADELAHRLTAPGGAAMDAIRAEFGGDFVDARGALDRARMRALAFADRDAKRRLEAILHPMVRAESERRVAASSAPYVILMIPLLVETGDPHARCDRVLVVDCPEELQVRRVVARSGFARADAEAIIASQASRAERLRHADDVIANDGSLEDLRPQVERLHRDYLARAGRG
ncbi:MAG: dephospho-CoA kinase [Burkholderiales bacterium]|nr:dephospho-CoA kinase [Burkholderiales bacterium]